MKKQDLILGILLFLIGMLGVASLTTMNIELPEAAKVILEARFTPLQIKLLLLINPTVMLLAATVIGTLLYRSTQLELPLLTAIIERKKSTAVAPILKTGVAGGILAGILILAISLAFEPFLPAEFLQLSERIQPTLATRFLYGGLTEEILLRYGFMTLVVWIAYKVTQIHSPKIYWMGILFSSIAFALGHFPIAFQAVSSPSTSLLVYILIGNVTGGIIFGWLYWKKGLEAAFIAHIFAHVTMVLGDSLL